jgi:hypothetical protein
MPRAYLARRVVAALSWPDQPRGWPSRVAKICRRTRQQWAERLRRGAALGLGLVPGWALACPTCVERAPESLGRSALLVGAMMLLPFLLVGLGAWAAIRAARGDGKGSV